MLLYSILDNDDLATVYSSVEHVSMAMTCLSLKDISAALTMIPDCAALPRA